MKKTLNVTGAKCTIAQLFVKGINFCFDTVVGKIGTNLYFVNLIFDVYIFAENKHLFPSVLNYKAQGILSSVSKLLIKGDKGFDAQFHISGTDIQHDKHKNVQLTEWRKGQHFDILSEHFTQNVNNTYFSPGTAGTFSDRMFGLKPEILLVPGKGTDLFINVSVHSQMPTHSGSPVFYICLMGTTSWIALHFTPSNNNFDHLKMSTEKALQSLRIPNREAIVVSLEKAEVDQVVILQINISFKVNVLVCHTKSRKENVFHSKIASIFCMFIDQKIYNFRSQTGKSRSTKLFHLSGSKLL